MSMRPSYLTDPVPFLNRTGQLEEFSPVESIAFILGTSVLFAKLSIPEPRHNATSPSASEKYLLISYRGRWLVGVGAVSFGRPDGRWCPSRPRAIRECSPQDAMLLMIDSGRVPPDELVQQAKAETTGEPRAAPTVSPVGADRRDAPDDLTSTQKDILRAALDLGAFEREHAATLEELVKRAFGQGKHGDPLVSPDARHIRDAVALLKKRGLLMAKRGTGGGCWITPQGRQVVEG